MPICLEALPVSWSAGPLLQVTGNNGVLTIAVDQPPTDSKEGGEQEKDKEKDEEKKIVHRCITMPSAPFSQWC